MNAGLPHVGLFFLASAVTIGVCARSARHSPGALRTALRFSLVVLSVLAVHELSFFVRPTREWIRVDLLLSIPCACALDLGCGLACRKSPNRTLRVGALILAFCALLGVATLLVGG